MMTASLLQVREEENSSALGTPVPLTDHALSVSMPTWRDTIRYMERDRRVLDALLSGYPRFFIPLNVRKLEKVCEQKFGAPGERCLLFPSRKLAEQCRAFVTDLSTQAGSPIPIHLAHFTISAASNGDHSIPDEELHIVLFPETASELAKEFWMHTGTGISSRRAVRCQLLLGEDAVRADTFSCKTRGAQAECGRTGDGGFHNVARTRGVAEPPLGSGAVAKLAIRRRIAGLLRRDARAWSPGDGGYLNGHGLCEQAANGVASGDVWLFPAGMSAIWHAHQLCMGLRPGAESICFGFPYVDTYKCLEKWGPGVHFYGSGSDDDIDALESFLRQEKQNSPTWSISALFTEFPFNPRLRSPNLPRLRELADKYDFPIIVDDTVGNFANVDVLPYADILVTSLSKIFSGDANVMGGSLVINPRGRYNAKLKTHLAETFEDTYFEEDAIKMELNSRDFHARNAVIDANTLAVCEFLRSRSLGAPSIANSTTTSGRLAIKDVFYPKWMTRDNYDACRARDADGQPLGGYGGLFSLTFVSLAASRAFFDALPCAKGPSLGTNFTLSCPYTIIAHYWELEWAASWGVEEGLVRISVGMEDKETLLRWVGKALCAAEAVVEEVRKGRRQRTGG
ncbi:pyridoxal phosphate-dependent transferase [Fomes fomentarius]|nr:pyridoxal phosphate-dependent transferase [Fomes fomentarius]